MRERRYFNPQKIQRPTAAQDTPDKEMRENDGRTYVYYNEDVVLAVNIALATNRPLLLSGPSGCGKSTVARNVALSLGTRYYEQVITARTEARDLLYRFDTVRRLNDAQSFRSHRMPPLARYIEPGALWWALSPQTAVNRGSPFPLPNDFRARDPAGGNLDADAVILIDEIDKADPDLPNSLLVPLGSYRFKVDPIDAEITSERIPLIFITNNAERDLPAAFVRRCVALTLTSPNETELVDIAREVVPLNKWNEQLFQILAKRIIELADDPELPPSQRSSTAEFLDAVRACCELEIQSENDPDFRMLQEITMRKQPAATRSSM